MVPLHILVKRKYRRQKRTLLVSSGPVKSESQDITRKKRRLLPNKRLCSFSYHQGLCPWVIPRYAVPAVPAHCPRRCWLKGSRRRGLRFLKGVSISNIDIVCARFGGSIFFRRRSFSQKICRYMILHMGICLHSIHQSNLSLPCVDDVAGVRLLCPVSDTDALTSCFAFA